MNAMTIPQNLSLNLKILTDYQIQQSVIFDN